MSMTNLDILGIAERQLKSDKTIREAAKDEGISKSYLHFLMRNKLHDIDEDMGTNIDEMYKRHKREGQRKGGKTTSSKRSNSNS